MKNRTKMLIITVAMIIGFITACTTTKLVETPPGSGNFKKVVEVDQRLTTGLQTTESVSGALGPINPWHGLVTIVLGGIAAAAEWNKRRKQAQLDTVVAGVEAKGGNDVKAAIQSIAMTKGIEDSLNKTVKRVTGG